MIIPNEIKGLCLQRFNKKSAKQERAILNSGSHKNATTSRSSVQIITVPLALFFAFLYASAALATPGFKYDSTLSLTTGSAGHTRPVSVTWDQVEGEICVTDVRQTTLHVLNSQDIELFRTSTVARLSLPADGCVDRQGRLLCVDSGPDGFNTIKRLNVYGEPDDFNPEIPGQEWNPRNLLVTRDGHYLTLDPVTALLAKHDQITGRLLWARNVAVPGQTELFLGRPFEAANGNLYIPGGNMGRILVLSAEGQPLTSFGEFGSAEGYFSFPVAVAQAPGGEILVLDRMRHKIMVFNSDHRFVREFGSLGAAPGQFYHPVAMAADADGRVYVAQGFQGRVQVFRYTPDAGLEP